MLFDKIAAYNSALKIIPHLALAIASSINQHCDNCVDTLSFAICVTNSNINYVL